MELYVCFFSLTSKMSTLYPCFSTGVSSNITEQVLRPKKSFISKTSSSSKDVRYTYNIYLAEKILQIILFSCQPSSRARLVTLELALKIFIQIAMGDGKNILSEPHKVAVETAKTQSTALLRNFYKSEEIFLDMFEYE